MLTIQMQGGATAHGTQPEKKAGFLGRVIVRTNPHYHADRLKHAYAEICIGAKVTENTLEIAANEYQIDQKGIFEPLRRAMIAGYSVLAGGFCSILNPIRTFQDLFMRDSRGKVNERAETALKNLDEKSDDWALKLYRFCDKAPMHQLSDDTLVKFAKKAVEAWDHHVVIKSRKACKTYTDITSQTDIKTYADTFSQTDMKTYADMTAQTDMKTYADMTAQTDMKTYASGTSQANLKTYDDANLQTDSKTYDNAISQTDTPKQQRAEVSNTSTRTYMNPFRPQTTQESIGGEETDTEPPVFRTDKSFYHTDTTNLQTGSKTYADASVQTDTPEKQSAEVSNTSSRSHMNPFRPQITQDRPSPRTHSNPFRPQITQESIGGKKTDTELPSRTDKSFHHTDTTNTRNTPLQVNINPASGVADNAYVLGTLGGYWQGNSDGFNRGYMAGEDHERDRERHQHHHHQSGPLDWIGGLFHHHHHQG